MLCLGFLLGCTVFQCESPRAFARMSSYYMFGWIHSVPPIVCDCYWPPRDSYTVTVTHTIVLISYFEYFVQRLSKKFWFVSSSTHVLYTDTSLPEYWCCMKFLGKLLWMCTRFDKVSILYTIEAILHWMLTHTSIAFGHLTQNVFTMVLFPPRVQKQKIPFFIFRVNFFSKATKALMYPHSSYSLHKFILKHFV